MQNDLFRHLNQLYRTATVRISRKRIKELEEKLAQYEDRASAKALLEKLPLMLEIAATGGWRGLEIMPLFNGKNFQSPLRLEEETPDFDIMPHWLVGNAKTMYNALSKAGYAPQLVVFLKYNRGIKRISQSYWAIVVSW